MKGQLLAYFELLRFPAVFTAVADVMMGYLVTQGDLHPSKTFLLLATVSASLYLGGMVLNDAYDAEVDSIERPLRPIPSGRVRHTTAAVLGAGLLLGGVLIAYHIGGHTGVWRPAEIAVVLAASVLLYDAGLKQTFAGPLVMGACRTLNVLLGMSLASQLTTSQWTVAIAVGTYVAAVSWLAKREVGSPAIQSSIRYLLRGIIVIDAAIVLGFVGPAWAIAVLALLAPMLLAERWASTT